jgi:hypothetical protein
MRITKAEVRGMFKRLVKAMGEDVERGDLVLDYVSHYGGYVIEEISFQGGVSHPFGCVRRTAKEMYLSMYMAVQALEDMRHKQEQLNKCEAV